MEESERIRIHAICLPAVRTTADAVKKNPSLLHFFYDFYKTKNDDISSFTVPIFFSYNFLKNSALEIKSLFIIINFLT